MDSLIPKAKTLISALVAIGVAAYEAFKALNDFSNEALKNYASRESQVKSYEKLFGDRDVARFEYGRAQQISTRTNLTSDQTLSAQRALTIGKIKGPLAHDLLAGITDLGTLASDEDRGSVIKRSAYAMREIQTMGKLRSRQLNMQLGSAGLDVSEVHRVIAENHGFHANKKSKLSTHDQMSDFADALIRKGAIRSEEGLKAIAIALSRQLNDGGKLGGFASNQAGTITSLQTNKDKALKVLQTSFDSDILPSVRAYKEALKDSFKAMDANTNSGKNLRVVLADISNTGIGLKAIFEEFSASFITGFGESYNRALKDMGITTIGVENGLLNTTEAAKKLATAISGIGYAVGWVIHQFDDMGRYGDVIRHMYAGDKGFIKMATGGSLKEKYAGAKEYFGAMGDIGLDIKRAKTSDLETPAQVADRLRKEMDTFSLATAGSKDGGTNKGGKGHRAVSAVSASVEDAEGGSSAGGGAAHGGGGGEAGGGGGSFRSGGLKIGVLHLELHVGGHWDDHAKQAIRDESPVVLKEMLEKAIVEMGL